MQRAAAVVLGMLASLMAAARTSVVAAPPAGQVQNLRVAISGGPWAAGDWVAFTVDEEDRSLNGDADTLDTVVCAASISRLQVTVLGVAVAGASALDTELPPVALGGDQAAVLVSEADQGGRDLNGDGDIQDDVLHLVNLRSHQLRNLRVAAEAIQMSDRWLAAAVPEAKQGKQDLNGDGDALDTVALVFDLTTVQEKALKLDPAMRLRRPEATGGIALAGHWLLSGASEASQGGQDLNSDGDTQDLVAQRVDLRSGEVRNLGVDITEGYALTPRLAALAVAEARQGGRDLNGDQDAGDAVLHVYDLEKSERINTRIDASSDVVADGRYAVAIALEQRQGNQDLNGDGDVLDEIAHVYDLEKHALINTRLDAADGAVVVGDILALACLEENQGNQDLNGDRDRGDSVVHLFQTSGEKTLNTRLTFGGEMLVADGQRLAFAVFEGDQGDRDLNGDGDRDDTVPAVLNLAGTPGSRILALACGEVISLSAAGAAFAVVEVDHADRDLNGNGNSDDEVLHLYRWTR